MGLVPVVPLLGRHTGQLLLALPLRAGAVDLPTVGVPALPVVAEGIHPVDRALGVAVTVDHDLLETYLRLPRRLLAGVAPGPLSRRFPVCRLFRTLFTRFVVAGDRLGGQRARVGHALCRGLRRGSARTRRPRLRSRSSPGGGLLGRSKRCVEGPRSMPRLRSFSEGRFRRRLPRRGPRLEGARTGLSVGSRLTGSGPASRFR